MSIPMLGLEDIVGKRFGSVGLVVVEELRVGERNLKACWFVSGFFIF